MQDRYISNKVREAVAKRANYRCEYCRIDEGDTYLSCEVDHIISLKHGGNNDFANLAYTCFPCNRYKGSDIATLDDSGNLTRLFHPREDNWNEHFDLNAGVMISKTEVAAATIKLLKLNSDSRIEERLEIEKSKL